LLRGQDALGAALSDAWRDVLWHARDVQLHVTYVRELCGHGEMTSAHLLHDDAYVLLGGGVLRLLNVLLLLHGGYV
jgi:hypothetical protein